MLNPRLPAAAIAIVRALPLAGCASAAAPVAAPSSDAVRVMYDDSPQPQPGAVGIAVRGTRLTPGVVRER